MTYAPKKTLLVADTKAKKLVSGLVDIHEAVELTGGHFNHDSTLEIVRPVTHLDRLTRFARKEWNAGRDHLTSYVKRLGWLTPELIPAG